jgi:NTP pyrophosphatase (non-canonical NTP hydrolase)
MTEQKAQYGSEQIDHPDHYTRYPVEVIEIIKQALSQAYGHNGFMAYCLGNEIKYRMRAGLKGNDDGDVDIGKAMRYMDFRESAEKESARDFDITPSIGQLEYLVQQWAWDKGILNHPDLSPRIDKFREEAAELVEAAYEDIGKDAVMLEAGDVLVTLINMLHYYNLDLRNCLHAAYEKIKSRTGKTVNGQFVRDREEEVDLISSFPKNYPGSGGGK